MGRRNKSGRQGNLVHQNFYQPFWERGQRYSSPSRNRIEAMEVMYVRILTEMCLGRYTWKNLPDSVSERFLELTLFRNALVTIFHHEPVGKVIAARAFPSGGYNMQDDPIAYTVSGNHMSGKQLKAGDVVPVWANALRVPDWDIVQVFAWRFAQLDRTIEINTNNARRSKILAFNDNQRLTAQNINQQLDDGEGTIPVNASLGNLSELITALDLGVEPRTLSELSVLRNQEWNRCMGLLGINNSNQDKKERLVQEEVSANDDQVSTARETNLAARMEGAKAFNKRFPALVALNGEVTVSYHDVNGAAPAIGIGSDSIDA